MKRIKCNSCAKAWIIEDANLEKLRVCPYCAVSIRGKIKFSEFDTLDKAIYGAIIKLGKDVLTSPRKLSGFMMDMAPALKKEIKIFSKTVSEEYTDYIKSAFEQDVETAKMTISKLRHLFIEEEGLSENWADMICNGFYGAVLYTKGIGITRMINVEINDYAAAKIKIRKEDQEVQNIIEKITSSVDEKKENPVNQSKTAFNILRKYRCFKCGYTIDGYELKYSSKKCPKCGAISWR